MSRSDSVSPGNDDRSSGESDSLPATVTNDELEKRILEWQMPVMQAYARGHEIRFRESPSRHAAGVWRACSRIPCGPEEDTGEVQKLGILPCVRSIIVGTDIQEYSRRKPQQQLFMTLCLYACVTRAAELLRDAGILSREEPRVTVQTGDGAYAVFTFLDAFDVFRKPDPAFPEREYAAKKHQAESRYLPHVAEQAFSFVFALNALVHSENVRQGFVDEPRDRRQSESPVFPLSVRYAMSFEDVLLMLDVNESLNCVGSGMITCNRILSADHGNHFLVQDALLRELQRYGGLDAVGDRQWGQRLHHTLLPETRVKSSHVRYADVFGFHNDRPLLRAQGRPHAERAVLSIGSHDVGSLERRDL